MEPTNYLEQARAFLGGRAKRLALQVVPLALAVASSHAGTINTAVVSSTPTFNPSSGSISAPNGGSSSGSAFSAAIPFINGVNGIKFYGAASLSWSSGSGNMAQLEIVYSGTGSGTFTNSTIPFSYIFTLADNINAPVAWQLRFNINGNLVGDFFGTTGNGGGPVSGSGILNLNNLCVLDALACGPQDFSNWSTQFDATYTSPGASTLNWTIPHNSIDINPNATTPEPASLLLFAPGAAFLILLRKRRQRCQA